MHTLWGSYVKYLSTALHRLSTGTPLQSLHPSALSATVDRPLMAVDRWINLFKYFTLWSTILHGPKPPVDSRRQTLVWKPTGHRFMADCVGPNLSNSHINSIKCFYVPFHPFPLPKTFLPSFSPNPSFPRATEENTQPFAFPSSLYLLLLSRHHILRDTTSDGSTGQEDGLPSSSSVSRSQTGLQGTRRAPDETPGRSSAIAHHPSQPSTPRSPWHLHEPLFDIQGWSPFCYNHKQYLPTAVTEFFNNLRQTVAGDLYSKVKGTSFRISPNLFSVSLHIPNTGIDIMSHHPTPEEYHQLITLQPYDPKDRKQLNANSYPLLHRLIHHIFTTIIVPKDGSRELVTAVQFHAFLNCEPINLPQLMVSTLRICLRSSKRSMPYVCQLTSLFLFLDIPILKEEMTALNSRSSYDLTAVQRMGYKMVDGVVTRNLKGKGPAVAVGDGEDEEEDEDEDGDEEQDTEDSQSEPLDAPGDGDRIAAGDIATEPSIRELLAQLQVQITTGFATLNDRLDIVDTSLEALADSQVHLQLRLTRLSNHVQENRQAPAPLVRYYARHVPKQGSKDQEKQEK
ncbi:hypothetical protein Taro_030783 [Colocasia esculenta]|uniref:Uncharacterized protein n=1 Tax=Colocasia esculenta TaxID=4460 RepID=A0A843VM95_COLES|nr:hypothetical protein [Colocasia esculenta]